MAQHADLLAEHERRPWDLIVGDPMALGTRFAAERLGTRWATLSPIAVWPLGKRDPTLTDDGAAIPPSTDLPHWWHDVAGSDVPVVHVTQGTANVDPDDLVLPTLEALAGEDVLVVVGLGHRTGAAGAAARQRAGRGDGALPVAAAAHIGRRDQRGRPGLATCPTPRPGPRRLPRPSGPRATCRTGGPSHAG